MSDNENYQVNKSHHKKKSAKKFKNKGNKDFEDTEENKDDNKSQKGDEFDENYRKARERNPKAFALQSYVAAERQFRRFFYWPLQNIFFSPKPKFIFIIP
jgi:hypothetical protein